MTNPSTDRDLVVLVSDKNMEFAIRGLLSRHKALGIRPVDYEAFFHPEKDPGCFLRGHDFLRLFCGRFSYALVMFDREGCGRDAVPVSELEAEVEERLARSGWGSRGAAIVLDPELDVWVWVDSPHVDSVLGWQGKSPTLREWLANTGLWPRNALKPLHPKFALEEALRLVRKPRSSSLYRDLAERVTLSGCTDSAFARFKITLQRWFLFSLPQGGP